MSDLRQGQPFPRPLFALALTLAAAVAIIGVVLAFGSEAPVLAEALAYTLAFGGVGSLAARFVPEPADLRLGLTPFSVRAMLPTLLLLPSLLLLSELDNWIRAALAAAPIEGLGIARAVPAEGALLAVLLLPVLQEFFFRGVLQQGCIARLGARRGVLFVALLQGLLTTPTHASDVAGALSASAQLLALGVLLGFLRIATGSLLPGIALCIGSAGLTLAAEVFADRVPIAGFNAPGATTPLALLLPALLSVALACRLLVAELTKQPALPPIPLAAPEDDEEPGPFL